ncbi:MAG TPA: hypothetical protein VMV72_00215 [Verrucomicrobiae bacterium]|nr:hypothetical protein [Verrucomicrobiae bacterium]
MVVILYLAQWLVKRRFYFFFRGKKHRSNSDSDSANSEPKSTNGAALSTCSSMCLISSALRIAWEFVRLHPGASGVFVGVTGEIILAWTNTEHKFKKSKRLFWTLIVVGLAYELIETARTDREVADINSTNAVLSLRAEELRKANLELALRLSPRPSRVIVGKLADKLKNGHRGEAVIFWDDTDTEEKEVGLWLAYALQTGGWKLFGMGPFGPKLTAEITSVPFDEIKNGVSGEMSDDLCIFANNLESPAALSLFDSLQKCGLYCGGWGHAGLFTNDMVAICIKKKP